MTDYKFNLQNPVWKQEATTARACLIMELKETLRDLEAIERIPQEDPGYGDGCIDTIKNILGTDAPSRDEQVQKFYHDTEEYLKKLEKETQQK